MEIRLNKFLTAFCKSFGNSTWKSPLQDYDNELTKYLLKKAGLFRYICRISNDPSKKVSPNYEEADD